MVAFGGHDQVERAEAQAAAPEILAQCDIDRLRQIDDGVRQLDGIDGAPVLLGAADALAVDAAAEQRPEVARQRQGRVEASPF